MQENLFFLAEQLVFCILTLWGLSLLAQTRLWTALIKLMYSQNAQTLKLIYLACGALCLPFGLFLVLTHNDWEFTPSVIVTIVGWCALVKCIVLLLFPQAGNVTKILYSKSERFLKWYLRCCGLIYVLAGLVVFCHFWDF